MRTAARSSEEPAMTDYIWLGAVTALIFGYLFYAMLAPEKF
jgi:K+-transporting ATPase KdpF subunit